MIDQEILEKAIQKAIDGGWNATIVTREDGHVNLSFGDNHQAFFWDGNLNHFDIIFSREFAKALWGENQIWWGHANAPEARHEIPAWQYHLQMMVIADDPIKYLGDNI